MTDLARLAARAGEELEGAPAEQIMRWALEQFHPRLAVASSMADAVLVHLASRLQPDVPVLFLDTGYHFAETLGTRDAVASTYPIKLIDIAPKQSVTEQDEQFGPRLYERDPDLCCRLRKVEPLERALEPYAAWASGIRRSEAQTRTGVRVVEWDARRAKVKVNPIAAWSDAEVSAYVREHGILTNPLLADGYDSVGCAPCTRRGTGRSGRWVDSGKVECGLHVS